ncbi:hypothetical protein BLNAU_13599 [Blattamonas nauphoetae]|uniref:Uncharacterized protein n=1 Tax=Blattamonas nauphoetae TaxID=2049346 RepID=A0ABQ9XG45_9EUKA|nr:hypothetical protein BLNAU_13599 [Blattamonas nauphoetae]
MPLHHHHNSVLNHPGLSLHSDRTRRDPREHRFFHRNLSLNTISSQHYKIVRPILLPTPHHPNLITISSKSHNLETLVQTESTCPPQTNNQTPPFSHLSTSNKVYFGTTNRSSLILNQPSHFSRLPSLDHPARHKTSETESTLHQTAPLDGQAWKGKKNVLTPLQRKEL